MRNVGAQVRAWVVEGKASVMYGARKDASEGDFVVGFTSDPSSSTTDNKLGVLGVPGPASPTESAEVDGRERRERIATNSKSSTFLLCTIRCWSLSFAGRACEKPLGTTYIIPAAWHDSSTRHGHASCRHRITWKMLSTRTTTYNGRIVTDCPYTTAMPSSQHLQTSFFTARTTTTISRL